MAAIFLSLGGFGAAGEGNDTAPIAGVYSFTVNRGKSQHPWNGDWEDILAGRGTF